MNLTSTLAQQFAKYRTVVAVITLGVTLAALAFLPSLRIDDNFNHLLRQSVGEDSRGLETEADDNACLLLIEGGDVLAAGQQDALRNLVVALGDADQVVAVYSIFDARKPRRFGRYYLPLISGSPESAEELQELRERALQHPLIAEKMLSADGHTTLVIVELNPDLQRASEYKRIIDELHRLAEEHLAGTPLRAGITGIPALQVEMTEALKWEQVVFVSGAEVMGLLICLLVFRRWAALLVVQAGPLAAVVWSVGAMAAAGEPLNVINCVLAPLVLTIALTDSVHLVLRIRAAREAGSARLPAVLEALQHVGPACFLTSLTTAIAFASLATASIEVIQRFGLTCAVAVICAFFAVITVVPLLACSPLGDRLVRRTTSPRAAQSTWALWLDSLISRGRWALSAIAVSSTALLLVVSMRLEPDIQMQQFLPSYGAALKTLRRCDEVFKGLLPVYVVVEWNASAKPSELLEALAEVEAAVTEEPRLSAPWSIVSTLRSLSDRPDEPVRSLAPLRYLPSEKIERMIHFEERRALVISRIRDVGTRRVMPLYTDMQRHFDELEARWPNLDFRLTGWTVSAGRLSESMLSDLMQSLYIAVLVSFGILAVAFRSFSLGVVSLIPNLFPLVATAATMVWLDMPLHFSSATVFSVCFGIAVDDTIHFLSSYSHGVRHGKTHRLAIRHTLSRVGEALLASTIIMVCAFGVVVFSNVPSIREFATAFIVVLAWALVGDLLFLPALLSLGRRRQRGSSR